MSRIWARIKSFLRGFKRMLLFFLNFWDHRGPIERNVDRWKKLGAKIADGWQFQNFQIDERFSRLFETEEEVNIAEGVDIILHDSSLNNLFGIECPVKYGKVLVKKRAYIGRYATVLPGVTIGAYSLTAARSVVTKDVPDYAVVGGVPAKIIGDTREMKEQQKELIAKQDESPFRYLPIHDWHVRHKIMTNEEVEEVYQDFFRKVGW